MNFPARLISPLKSVDSYSGAGRMCPRDYRYSPSVLARPADMAAETLYVAGGLYGNLAALDVVERLAARERAPVTIVFNGDYHWFDAQPDWFTEVESRIAPHAAMRGNVETEIARSADIGAGCGCAYPASVGEDAVRRSNEILSELRSAAALLPGRAARLGRLPMHNVAQVNGLRIGIVHGDATALAGWGFAQDSLDAPDNDRLADIRRASRIDVFACAHTCLAVLRDFTLPGGRLTIVNNGAAGMPNFAGSRFGVLTRIAVSPAPHAALYGVARDGVYIDAIALRYDQSAFLDRFLARWPPGSPAHASYHRRIVHGPDYSLAQAGRRR